MIPGRTHPRAPPAARRAPKRSVAALLHTDRSPGRSCVAASNAGERRLDCRRARPRPAFAEVGHQRDRFDLRERVEAQPRGAQALGREAEPVHAAVHSQDTWCGRSVLSAARRSICSSRVNDVPELQPEQVRGRARRSNLREAGSDRATRAGAPARPRRGRAARSRRRAASASNSALRCRARRRWP